MIVVGSATRHAAAGSGGGRSKGGGKVGLERGMGCGGGGGRPLHGARREGGREGRGWYVELNGVCCLRWWVGMVGTFKIGII